MIAVDTNVLRRYLRGTIDRHAILVAESVNSGSAHLPPVVLAEALSDPHLSAYEFEATLEFPLLPLYAGYWYRAGNLRRQLRANERAAPVADCLIAQACIDLDIPLLTFDAGFTRFIGAGLKLL